MADTIKLIPKKAVDLSKVRRREPVRCHNRRCLRLYDPKFGGALFCCEGCRQRHEADNGGDSTVKVKGLRNVLDSRSDALTAAPGATGCICGGLTGRVERPTIPGSAALSTDQDTGLPTTH